MLNNDGVEAILYVVVFILKKSSFASSFGI